MQTWNYVCLLLSSVRNLKYTEAVFLLEVKQTSHETKPFVREFPPLSVTVGLAETEEAYDTEANGARRRQVIM